AMQGERRVDRAMHRARARIRLEADLIAAPCLTECLGQGAKVKAARLVELEEAVASRENFRCAGEALLRQQRGHDAAGGTLPCLESFGERSVEDALACARRLAERDAEGIVQLLRCQPEQLSRNDGRTEHADSGSAVPSSIHRGGERDAA